MDNGGAHRLVGLGAFVSYPTLPHFPFLEDAVATIARVSNPGVIIILCGYNVYMKRFLVGLALCLSASFISGCGRAPELSPEAARLTNDLRAKSLGLATKRYSLRSNDILPNMGNATAFKADLLPFLNEDPIGGEEIFTQVDAPVPFEPNPSLSKKNEADVKDPRKIALVYQAEPSPNKTRAVVFGDGHFRRIDENEWPALKAASSIP
jgi:hypothetical protein